MDNADLEKLAVSPGRLNSKFHPNTTEYYITLGSDVKQIKVDPLTSDSGASYCITGGDGGKTIPLREGQTTAIKIEVTAEDGSTIKNYFVHATRLSPSDASLSELKVSTGCLVPPFSPQVTSYTVNVPYSCSSVAASPTAADKKTTLKLNGSGELKEPVSLNYGETRIEVEVISPDGSQTKVYLLVICRLQIARPVSFANEKLRSKFECPVCLGVLYRPKSIQSSSPKHIFCKCCIDELTRTSKQDPLDETPLKGEWRVDENTLETELSTQLVHCVYHHWGCQEMPALQNLGGHAKQCGFRPVVIEKTSELVAAKDLEDKTKDSCATCPGCSRQLRTTDLETHKSHMCPAKHAGPSVQHKVELRSWEKKLRQETSEKSADKLIQLAKEQVDQYFKSLPHRGCSEQYSGETSPLKYLEAAAEWCASASKISPKNAEFHFLLAQVFEEQHSAQDLYGLKLPKAGADEDDFGFNAKLKISTEEEDTQALCEMRGVARNAPLALQLKAIDEEYHYLLEQGQSDKADYVQKLYALKSQQASKESNKTAQLAGNEEESLGKAFYKYLDALSCDPDGHVYSLHVGRLLLLQGKPDEAVTRLQVAVGLKPMSVEDRFYLGLALCQQKGGPGPRTSEATKYVSEGLELVLKKLTSDADNADQGADKKCRTELLSNSLLHINNTQCLQAFTILGNLVSKSTSLPAGVMSAVDAYRTTTLLSSRVLGQLVVKGDTYHQVQWLLLEAHSLLLQMMLESGKEAGGSGQSDVISRYCENLSALITSSTLPPGGHVTELQEKTCQQAVLLQPCNSRALYRLGDAQLRCYDNNPTSADSKRVLEEAEQSFRTSMQLEGQPCEGGVVPGTINQQRWFKEREAKQKAAEMKAKETAAPRKTPGGTGAKAGTPTTRGRGGTASRGGAVSRGTTPSTRGGSSSAARAPPTAARGKTSPTKGGATSGRGAARGAGGRGTGTGAKPAGSTSKTTQSAGHKAGACAAAAPAKTTPSAKGKATSAPTPAPEPVPSPQTEPKASGPPNKPSYQARLGLARVLARKGGDDVTESHKLYEEVIDMVPEFHDAYIELADALVGSDPLKAVDIYSKYPFKEPLTFDDAYIYGEVVRLLMKQKQYGDPRLPPALISLGKVLGLSVIEKHVEVLDKTFKYSKLLMQVYAGVHGKDVDDPDLKQFFKFKCWI